MVATEVQKFKGTVTTQKLLSDAKHSIYSAMRAFDEYPTREVRESILKQWADGSDSVLNSEQADWVEARICDLKKEDENTYSSTGFWKRLLGWYVFNTDTVYRTALIGRALDFAIKLTEDKGYFYRSDVLKMIAGRLDRTPHIYPTAEAPRLKSFLESFLVYIYHQPEGMIADYKMIDVRRVVRCAVAVEDWSFLPHIKKVRLKLFQSLEHPKKYDFAREVEILETEAFLRETERFFKEKIAEEEAQE